MLDRSRFVAVVGSSGSGKSSLVFAGLCPLLDRENRDAGGRNWLWQDMSPGALPLDRLIDLLDRLTKSLQTASTDGTYESQHDRFSYLIRNFSSRGLVQALAEIEGLKGKTLLLVIDQFEELFRYSAYVPGRGRDDALLSREESRLFVKLLLEASRDPNCDVRVLITLRSDFIGDCGRFQGLPEAVSETQFLVPSLTPRQREEVIRKPIEKVDATINGMLVERLLNDNSEDMDQLPVLQHCLLRLWDEAGREALIVDASPARHLMLEHYQAIGRMEGALSRHADEILRGLPGLEFAVQLVFRALAEFDKDGRVIRRAISFEQLLAETGLSEADLRMVLDRFRDPDCSFLRPAPPQELEKDTLIDVGHEALLRRWERVSGKPTASPGAGVADAGWLAVERRDAGVLHALLARAKEEDPIPFRQVKRRLGWWATPGHTLAWAERYGGGFAQVQKLLDKSQSVRRMWSAAIVAGLLGASGGGFWGYQSYAQWQHVKEKMHHDTHEATQKYQRAVASQSAFLSGVLKALNRGTISVTGADELLKEAQKAIDEEAVEEGKGGLALAETEKPPEIVRTEADLMIVRSDIFVAQGHYPKALDEALKVWTNIAPFLTNDPMNLNWISLAYECKFRIADVYADSDLSGQPESLERALVIYGQALGFAEKLAAIQKNKVENRLRISFVRGKLGDVRLMQTNFAEARSEYEKSLEEAQTVADAAAEKDRPRRDLASAVTRIGWLLEKQGRFDSSLKQYRAALVIREQLAARATNDDVPQSHKAESHRAIGNVLVKLARPAEAIAEYSLSAEVWETLLRKDMQNTAWLINLGKVLPALADAHKSVGNRQGELESYGKAFLGWSNLAVRDRTRKQWQQKAASIGEIYGALLVDAGKSAEAIGVYRDIVDTRKSLAEADAPSVEARHDLLTAYVKLGDLLSLVNDQNAAADRYDAALAIAEESIRKDPNDGSWQQDVAMVRRKLGRLTRATGANAPGATGTVGSN